ncbi:hypothetical protein ACFSKU_06195 [Pontibacter silvestris]|uniref:Tetratricopeptide repeat protein n=1 Tax=Pontibacter silvestris TaxID=2305183 RepID=A0ABW4WWT6_9BACT|nr:hypothetical protein [Pontibacter silvestris]MCC9136425.1 hypothetical protein [Pontibacter silvestris]
MRRIFLSFLRSIAVLLFLLSISVNASAADPDYVEVYHPVIHQAEASILNKDYTTALAYYQQAFALVPVPFARDYYNAAVCAVLVNDAKQAFDYLEKLVLSGVSLAYLEQQEVFEPLHETRQWKKFKRRYPKRRREFRHAANLDLRADLDELYARDQYFRQAEGGLKVHGDTIRKIEAANVQKLLGWINQYGYPGEALIGVADTLEEVPRFSIVIQRQTKFRGGYDFSDILTTAVHEGKLAPQAAAFLMDVQAGRNNYKAKALVKVDCYKTEDCIDADQYFQESLSQKEREQIDELRLKLGLEPLTDYKRKVMYSLEDDRFKMNYAWSVATYKVPSKEAAEVLVEKLVVAEL